MAKHLKEILAEFEATEDQLIPILQKVQEELGYLSDESMFRIARYAKIPESRVFGVASFYEQFRFTPIGRTHISVCRGTACHVKGAP
ncbi:MAG: NADH-quinone oxidoreductase subunit NuoE family protein, partial [Planctomycetota bacterium]